MKRFLQQILFFLVAILSLPLESAEFKFLYPKTLSPVIPPKAVYEEQLSEVTTNSLNALKTSKDNNAKPLFVRYLFSTSQTFEEARRFLEQKKVQLIVQNKNKILTEIQKQGRRKQNKMQKLLRDPQYQSASGFWRGWVIHLSTFYIDPGTHDVLKLTTLTFTRPVRVVR